MVIRNRIDLTRHRRCCRLLIFRIGVIPATVRPPSSKPLGRSRPDSRDWLVAQGSGALLTSRSVPGLMVISNTPLRLEGRHGRSEDDEVSDS